MGGYKMKIAIHHNSGTFSERWIEYCKKKNIPYKIVNAYDNDIVQQVADCDIFMWHHHHGNYKDVLFAKQLLYSLEIAGKKVFPDFHTGWFFDDKVGQKYLLESIGAPLVPSYVFYTKKEALKWINTTSFPKVFKLRGGAGAANVRLVNSRQAAIGLVRRAFGSGFPQFNRWGYLKEQYRKWRHGKASLLDVCKGIIRLFISTEFAKMHAPEKGYVYFQDFIPMNEYDIRVIVIGGNKAFAVKRICRPNDFRASGSGNMHYDKKEIDVCCVEQSFKLADKLNCACIGFDWIFNSEHTPLIVEIGYGFAVHPYDACPGYWTSDMKWHEECFIPQEWMIEHLLKERSVKNEG